MLKNIKVFEDNLDRILMAQTKKSVSEFIQDAFCPMIAVLCSYDAESICRKNNLTFAELIQPFCRLPLEGKKYCHTSFDYHLTR